MQHIIGPPVQQQLIAFQDYGNVAFIVEAQQVQAVNEINYAARMMVRQLIETEDMTRDQLLGHCNPEWMDYQKFVFWNSVLEFKPDWFDIVDAIKSMRMVDSLLRIVMQLQDRVKPTREQLILIVPLMEEHAPALVHFLCRQPLVNWPSAVDIDFIVALCTPIASVDVRISFLQHIIYKCTAQVAPTKTCNLGPKLREAVAAISEDSVTDRIDILKVFLHNWPKIYDYPYVTRFTQRSREIIEFHNKRLDDVILRQRHASLVSAQSLPVDEKTEDKNKQCTLCNDNAKKLVIVPCGHYFACVSCYKRFVDNKCAYCRGAISTVVPLFAVDS